MHEVRSARLVTLGGLVVAGIVLAACGGSSSHAATVNAPTTTTTTAGGGGRGGGFAALTAFTSCMSSHGVTLPRRTGGNGSGGPPSTTPGETRPAGSFGGGGGGFGGGGAGFANRFKTAPAGVDPTKYKAAYDACASKLPTGTGGFAPNNTAFNAYRSCLMDHGVTLSANGGFGGINRNDPKVQAALKTCLPLLPAGFGRTTTTTAPAA